MPAPFGTTTTAELEMARMSTARGARVWSASWSPPARMKTNGAFMTGGSMVGNKANYESFAASLAGYVALMRSNGVTLYALSPQNEPDMSKPYPSATWTPQQIHDFVPYLYDALQSAGLSDTKIMIAEESQWGSFGYARSTMRDATVARQVGILAAHNYDGRSPSGPPTLSNLTTQHVWQTEASTFEPYDGSIDNALVWAQKIHAFLSKARVSAFHYWYLGGAPSGRTNNEALTDGKGNVALRAFAIGQWSKFVRPGWHQVAVANVTSALVTAFRSEDGAKSAIVAVNMLPTSVPVEIAVGTGLQGPVTPWMTSKSHSLSRQADIHVLGGTLFFDLPARSIVTFAGNARSN